MSQIHYGSQKAEFTLSKTVFRLFLLVKEHCRKKRLDYCSETTINLLSSSGTDLEIVYEKQSNAKTEGPASFLSCYTRQAESGVTRFCVNIQQTARLDIDANANTAC